MKKYLIRMLLIFLFISALFILLFYTFFIWEKKELTNSNSNFNITKIWEKSLSWVILDKVDFYTTIYSKNKDYKFKDNNIKLWTWIYLIDWRDIFSELNIDMWINNITLNGGWLVYINNNPKYKTITSFNNNIKVKFNAGAEVFLYPHMSFAFRPYRFEKEEELDSLRVSQLWELNYFNSNFSDIINWENISFIKKDKIEFLSKTLKDVIKKQKQYSKELDILKNDDLLSLKSTDYLEKYFYIFYNDRKKIVYYKNKTLKLLIDLINLNNNNIDSIFQNIKKIDVLDKREGDEMKKIIKEIFYLVSYSLWDDSYYIQKRYDLLISKLFNIDDTRKIKLIKDVDRYNYLWDFQKYLQLTDLNIENNNLSLLDREYYVLFKQKVLISYFKNLDLDQNDYNILLKWFISYSKNIEKNITEENKDKFIVNIKNNIILLEKLSLSLKKRYFENEKDSQNLLVFKRDKNIENINLIKKSIENIISKYKKANALGYLYNEQKYWNIKIRYNNIEKKLKEYVVALQNYNLYKKQYSKINKALLWVKVYENEELKLSKNLFLNYIKTFNEIDINSINVEVMEFYYKVNNISINGTNFSFDLYPYSWNTIKNIKNKDNIEKSNSEEKWFYSHLESTSYNLNREKIKYKKIFSKAKKEEKYKYDFKEFFKNTFFLSNNIENKTFTFVKKTNQDDEIIQTFKISKLLWNKWEFRNVKNLLDLKYSNLDVTRKTWKIFLIKIVNSNLKINIEEYNKKVNYGSLFNSDYKLQDNKHYFYNIKLEPFIKKNSWDKTILFPNVKFRIIWKIDLPNFENSITELFSKIKEIEKEYLKISKNKTVTKITYSALTWKYYIK